MTCPLLVPREGGAWGTRTAVERSVLGAGEAKVRDLDASTVGDEQVRGLDVTMEEPVLVCALDTAATLDHGEHSIPDRSWMLAEPVRNAAVLEVLHRDEWRAIRKRAGCEDLHDMVVLSLHEGWASPCTSRGVSGEQRPAT